MRKGYCSADARPLLFENGISYCMLTGACRIRKGWLLVIFVAVEICVYSMLIESHELNRKFCHELQGSPFVQPHSFPLDVRHNLLLSKESAMNLYKAPYPFVLRLEFAAVQIIAVDTVRNGGLCKAGYLIKAGHPIQNTVSTGDLNRGRRTKSRLLFGSFCRSKKNKPVSLAGRFEVLQTSNQLTQVAVSHRPLRGIFRRPSRLDVPCREHFTCF